MIKQYIKQSWALIKQNRFYTTIHVLGTGLAITMVMIMAIVYHIRTANITPESNRDRILVVERATARNTDGNDIHNWSLSYQTLKECYYPLQTPHLVAAGVNSYNLVYTAGDFYTGIPGNDAVHNSFIYCTDAAFFQVFDYLFIAGRPYSEEEFQSGMHYVVLSETLAYKLFHSNDILNETVLINDVEYTVTGVVKDVSPTLSYAYAELWIPYSSIPVVQENNGGGGGVVGLFTAFILAEKKADYPLIKEEIEQYKNKYNQSITGWEYRIDEGFMLNTLQSELRKLDYGASFNELILRYGMIAFIFLLVPAVNLSGIMSSRMQERSGELGIRKAFGASQGTLTNQVLTENMLLTLLGGMAGLIISFLIVYFMKDLLLGRRTAMLMLSTPEISISFSMLFNLRVFGYALGVCLILNILSSYIPIWNAARRSIVQLINDI